MQPQVYDHITDLYKTLVYWCADGCQCLVTVLQTRLTALDLIGYAAGDERPRQFVHMPEQELDQELVSIKVCLSTRYLCAVPQCCRRVREVSAPEAAFHLHRLDCPACPPYSA